MAPIDSPTLKHDLAIANRICAYEGVSMLSAMSACAIPDNPNRYFLSRSRAPELVEPDDFYEFDLIPSPSGRRSVPMYSERVIHGEIYKARPDVMAVCHHHSPAILQLLHHRREARAGLSSRGRDRA